LIVSPNNVVGQYQDVSKSFRVDKDHTHIKYGGNAIWVNKDGCFASTDIVVAPDNCK
jgi:hypothetical protein